MNVIPVIYVLNVQSANHVLGPKNQNCVILWYWYQLKTVNVATIVCSFLKQDHERMTLDKKLRIKKSYIILKLKHGSLQQCL